MKSRVVITIHPFEALVRVSVSIDGKRAPVYLRQFALLNEAVAYAETLGNVFALERRQVRIDHQLE